MSAAVGCWFELLHASPGVTVPVPVPTPRSSARTTGADIALVVVAGRPGEAATGLLASGTARDAAKRLERFVGYAATARPVRGALAPTVTSATITAEQHGTYTLDLDPQVVDRYLSAARSVGAELLLHVQPGCATLQTVVERWGPILREPDVGIVFDLRCEYATNNQRAELADVLAHIIDRFGSATTVAVIGMDPHDVPSGVHVTADVTDLRRGGRYPHDLLADESVELVVYR